jgi:oligosaccharide repeat unit polymerase
MGALKAIFNLLHSKYIFNLYIYGILIFLFFLEGTRSNFLFFFSQALIIQLCLFFINERPGLNLSTSFYGFSMIFLGMFPIAEFKMGVIYWGGMKLSDFTYIEASFLVLVAVIAFRLGYQIKFKSGFQAVGFFQVTRNSILQMRRRLTLKTISFLTLPCIYILSAYNYDIIALQFRGMGEEIETVFIFEFFFIKPLIFNIIFFYFVVKKSYGFRDKFITFIFFLLLIFFANPLSVPRFLAFSLFVPLVFVLSMYYLKRNYAYLNVVFFGMIFIFPILDIFRWFKVEDSFDSSKNMNLNYFFAGHFDAFQNFARTIDLNIHTYGYQIFGALFFFIPRAIWPSKPVGSGFLLADEAHLTFNNISMPLVSELYLDFSYFGIALGMLTLGIIYRRLDDKMSKIIFSDNLVSAIKIIAYSEFCCLQFYLLRGNLLACVAFITSIMASILVVYIYFYIFNKSLKQILNGIKP